jgi:hypothetical protein
VLNFGAGIGLYFVPNSCAETLTAAKNNMKNKICFIEKRLSNRLKNFLSVIKYSFTKIT